MLISPKYQNKKRHLLQLMVAYTCTPLCFCNSSPCAAAHASRNHPVALSLLALMPIMASYAPSRVQSCHSFSACNSSGQRFHPSSTHALTNVPLTCRQMVPHDCLPWWSGACANKPKSTSINSFYHLHMFGLACQLPLLHTCPTTQQQYSRLAHHILDP